MNSRKGELETTIYTSSMQRLQRQLETCCLGYTSKEWMVALEQS